MTRKIYRPTQTRYNSSRSQNADEAPNQDSAGSKAVLGCTIAGVIGVFLLGLFVAVGLFGWFFASVPAPAPLPVAPVPNVKPLPDRPQPIQDAIPEPLPIDAPEPDSTATVTAHARVRDVFADFHQELLRGDLDAALAMANGSPEGLESLRALHAFAHAAVEFRDRMVQVYGEEGWQTFNDSDGANLGELTEKLTPLTAEQLERMPVILEQPSVAFVWYAADKNWVRFQSIEGQWKIDADVFFTAEEREDVRILNGLAKVLAANLKQIGEDGVTPETLDQEMAVEILGAFLDPASPEAPGK